MNLRSRGKYDNHWTTDFDLALCTRSIAPHLDWTVLSDLHGSDHFAVIILISMPRPALEHAPHWILARADWAKFQESISLWCVFRGCQFYGTTFYHGGIRTVQLPFEPGNEHWLGLQRHPTMDNLIIYKQVHSRAWRVVRDSKKSSWRAYISSLTHHTSSRDVWQRVIKIKGTWFPSISGLLIHGSIETAPGAIVNKLASHFASVSSSNQYSPTFQITKVKEESKVLDFSTACSNDYNLSFTLSELQSSLSCAHNTAPGPDHIHNSM